MENVINILNEISEKANIKEWDKWETGKVIRIGKKKEGKLRPILIQSTLHWRKMEVLKNIKHFTNSIYRRNKMKKERNLPRNHQYHLLVECLKKAPNKINKMDTFALMRTKSSSTGNTSNM